MMFLLTFIVCSGMMLLLDRSHAFSIPPPMTKKWVSSGQYHHHHNNNVIHPKDRRTFVVPVVTSLSNRNHRNDCHHRRISSSSSSSTRLYRWNPVPDSPYYNRRDDDDDFIFIPPRPPRNNNGKRRRRRWFGGFGKNFSLSRILVYLNVLAFGQQLRSSIQYLPTLNAMLARVVVVAAGNDDPWILGVPDVLELWAWDANPIIIKAKALTALGAGIGKRSYGQSYIAASSIGPFTMDFVHQTLLTRFQPHRYLTAGFLHGSFLHLLFNMRYLWTLPGWLINASGWPLFLSTYLISIVTGNLGHTYTSSTGTAMTNLCLGASGGICGLNGLMYVLLKKMGNESASTQVFTNMMFLFLFGYLVKDGGVSNAAHIGGFLGGWIMGIFFGPTITKSYSMLRKFSAAVDETPPDLRELMGFGKQLNRDTVMPLWYLWAAIAMALIFQPDLRIIPACILKGFTQPGKLSGWQILPS